HLGSATPPYRQILLGFKKNLHDVLAFRRTEMGEFLGLILSRQHGSELGVDFLLELCGKRIKCAGINHVGAAVVEDAVEELKILERPSVGRVAAVPAKRILKR